MLRRLIPAALFSLVSGIGHAQTRTMNETAPGVVRAWPQSGAWLVTLSRSPGGDLFCAIGTGHQDRARDDNYVWGLRWRNGAAGVFVSDRKEEALAGERLRITVDGAPVGNFPVSRRRRVVDMVTVSGALTEPNARRVLSVMRHGGSMTFSTSNANYTAPLLGAEQALAHLDECNLEARDIGLPGR